MENNNDWKGEDRRLTKSSVDQLEIEIHKEKVRVWVDGASVFLADEKRVKVLVTMLERMLDRWFLARVKTVLAGFGLTALASMFMAFLVWLGWKGWGGK